MVNGNDLIEYEENYLGYLELDFLSKYATEFNEYCSNEYNIIEKFKEINKDKWDEFVMNSFNNSRGGAE